MNELGAQLGSPEVIADLDRMTRVLARQEDALERYEAAGGPGATGRARAALLELGLSPAELSLPTRSLSGGQRKLIALAACLEQQPDVLLLDEPEAHLDNEGRARVEQLARRFEGAIVAVSHDRYLLDEIVDQIASLDRGRIRLWAGNYSAYTLERELELQRQQQVYVTQQKEIERLEAAIARFKLWASWVPDKRNIRQANNKQRQIDRMDAIDRPVLERRKIALQLRPTTRGGQRVFSLRSVGVEFGEDTDLRRRRSRGRARRAARCRRPERRRQVGAPQDARRRDPADVRRGVARALDRRRLPGAGAGHARPRVHPARDGAPGSSGLGG